MEADALSISNRKERTMLIKSGSNLPKYELVLFGLTKIFDGCVAVMSLGNVSSSLSVKKQLKLMRKYLTYTPS